MERIVLVAIFVGAPCFFGAAAHAQDDGTSRWQGPRDEPTASEVQHAAQLYEQGRTAAGEHRWADAIELFEDSYALSGASVALYSLGFALRATGRNRDARDAFDQLLRLHEDELEAEQRTEAESLRAEVAARIAVLRLAGIEEIRPVRVELDGASVADGGERPLPVEADPGDHSVRVDADGFRSYEWRGRVGEGDRLTVEVELEAESVPIWERVWFWGAVGGLVVVGAVIAAIVIQNAVQLDPKSPHVIEL